MMNDVPADDDDPTDDAIEEALRLVVDAPDSPRRMAALDIFSWSRIDAELAELLADSRDMDQLPAATRALPESSAFQLTFSYAGQTVTVDVETTRPDGATVVVLLEPDSQVDEVEVATGNDTRTTVTVQNQHAVVRNVSRPGPIRISICQAKTVVAVSPWFLI